MANSDNDRPRGLAAASPETRRRVARLGGLKSRGGGRRKKSRE